MKNKENLFSAYVMASQIGFMVIAPLLLFIWGGSWLVNKFSLPSGVMVIFVILGLFTMISSVGVYLKRLIKMYDNKNSAPKISPLHHDLKDHDYYIDDR